MEKNIAMLQTHSLETYSEDRVNAGERLKRAHLGPFVAASARDGPPRPGRIGIVVVKDMGIQASMTPIPVQGVPCNMPHVTICTNTCRL